MHKLPIALPAPRGSPTAMTQLSINELTVKGAAASIDSTASHTDDSAMTSAPLV